MTQLPSSDKDRVWRGLMRLWSNDRTQLTLSKTQLRSAIDATDTWIDDNAPSFNAALPTAARTTLTLDQKTLLLCAVALARVSIAFLRKVLGQVD